MEKQATSAAMVLIERSTLVGALSSLRIAGVGTQVGKLLQLAIDSAEQASVAGGDIDVLAYRVHNGIFGQSFTTAKDPVEHRRDGYAVQDLIDRANIAPLLAELNALRKGFSHQAKLLAEDAETIEALSGENSPTYMVGLNVQDENAEFEKWRNDQISSLIRTGHHDGAVAFRSLGTVQWAGWQARARLTHPINATEQDNEDRHRAFPD